MEAKKKEVKTPQRWHGAHMYSNKVHLFLVFFLFFSAAIILWSYFAINKIAEKETSQKPAVTATPTVSKPTEAPVQVACTMEAKACPDGINFVGRTAPNCDFQACPGEHCGGNIKNAVSCLHGYHCQLSTSNPDTGGTCVKD